MANTICTLEDLCAKVNCLADDVDKMWDYLFEREVSSFVFLGNAGVPANYDQFNDPEGVFVNDKTEYLVGTSIVNLVNPNKGVFLLGDMNFDNIDIAPPDKQNYLSQEVKVNAGFAGFLVNQKLWPVMGDTDYLIAYMADGDVPTKMKSTYLRLFNYLPDAARYYSVYDEASSTEFYVLSSGRYFNYYLQDVTGFIYPNDAAIDGEQHKWLTKRTAASSAINKVVVFHHPFVSVPDTYQGIPGEGTRHVWNDFKDWDFEAMGIRLIMNGHAGSSFHLRNGTMHIVNASSFIRSRLGLKELQTNTEPPPIYTAEYGQPGWVVNYISHHPFANPPPHADIPATPFYSVPKNEFVKLDATKEGLTLSFYSFDPYHPDGALQAYKDMVLEHSFTIPANE